MLIVIDNINKLISNLLLNGSQYELIENFVNQCRRMGAIVILVSSEEIPAKINLDYLVDVSVRLKQVGIEDPSMKPIRLFQLIKTRHQASRQGSHVFHISSSKGFRLSPKSHPNWIKEKRLKDYFPQLIVTFTYLIFQP